VELLRVEVGSQRPWKISQANETILMYLLELIFRTIVNLAKHLWRLPQTIALDYQQRRRRLDRDQSETERLDRLRNPSKYVGRG